MSYQLIQYYATVHRRVKSDDQGDVTTGRRRDQQWRRTTIATRRNTGRDRPDSNGGGTGIRFLKEKNTNPTYDERNKNVADDSDFREKRTRGPTAGKDETRLVSARHRRRSIMAGLQDEWWGATAAGYDGGRRPWRGYATSIAVTLQHYILIKEKTISIIIVVYQGSPSSSVLHYCIKRNVDTGSTRINARPNILHKRREKTAKRLKKTFDFYQRPLRRQQVAVGRQTMAREQVTSPHGYDRAMSIKKTTSRWSFGIRT